MFRKQKVEKLKKFMKKFKLFAVILLVGAMGITSVSAQTATDLLAQLQALQTQVSNLQSQLRSVQGGSQTFTTSTNLLTVRKSGNGSGLIQDLVYPHRIDCGSDCTESYASGTNVWVYAYPASSSTFAGWMGCDQVSSTECRVLMSRDRAVEAVFTITTSTIYTLNVTKSGSGSGLVQDLVYPPRIYCGSDCTENYAWGTIAWLRETPDVGNTFGGWTGCDLVSSTQCKVVMNQNKTVNARFDFNNTPPQITYVSGPTRLAVNRTGSWTVSASDPDGDLWSLGMIWGDNTSSTVAVFGSSTTQTFNHSYSTAGLKTIYITARDSHGGHDSATTTVYVISGYEKRPLQYEQGGASLIDSAKSQLSAMVLQLQEMLKSLR